MLQQRWLKIDGDYIAVDGIRGIREVLGGSLEIVYRDGARETVSHDRGKKLRRYLESQAECGCVIDLDRPAWDGSASGGGPR
jgi:hypothetical protein